jgi:DNA-binding IclR family transcriptional regulator
MSNVNKEVAAEPGSEERLAVLLYLSKRPQGGTVEHISHGTDLPESICRCALAALQASETPLVRREGKPPVYYLPVARENLPARALVPGLVPAMLPTTAGVCA